MENNVDIIVRNLKEESGMFQLFGEEDLRKIAPYLDKARFEAGSLVFSEGDSADFIGFVLKGRLEIKKETSFRGKQIVLAHMSKGAVLGEVALFDSNPRSATVEALEDTELLILRNEAMDAFIESHPALGIKLLKGISRVLSLRLRQLHERLVVIF